MDPRVATDSAFQTSAFTAMTADSHDSGMRFRPRFLVSICALGAVGFGGGVLLLRPWNADSHAAAASGSGPIPASSSRPSAQPLSLPARESNPAAQRAGPPDPVTQRTATASAERAARAAADLASK